MDNPKTFLLKKIVGWQTNGLSTLGQLHGQHVEDISKVMIEFTKEAVNEIIDSINKGQAIRFDDLIIELPKKKNR